MIGLLLGPEFQTTFGNEYGNIELDATLQESHNWSAEVTTNPVEEGSPVTDHVIEDADRLIIKGVISDDTISLSTGLEQAVALITGKEEKRTHAMFSTLKDLIKLRAVMVVYTKYEIYTDMILTSVDLIRETGQGAIIEFTAEFVHVRFVATQVVDVPPGISSKKSAKADESTGRKSEPGKNNGSKQSEVIDKPSSTLMRIFQ